MGDRLAARRPDVVSGVAADRRARGRHRLARLHAAQHAPGARPTWQPAAEAFPPPPATAKFLLARRAAEGPSRFAWLTDRSTRVHQLRYGRAEPEQELLLNMAATRYGLDDVSGYDPVHLNSFSAYLRRSNSTSGSTGTSSGCAYRRRASCIGSASATTSHSPGSSPRTCPVVFRSQHAVIVEDPTRCRSRAST